MRNLSNTGSPRNNNNNNNKYRRRHGTSHGTSSFSLLLPSCFKNRRTILLFVSLKLVALVVVLRSYKYYNHNPHGNHNHSNNNEGTKHSSRWRPLHRMYWSNHYNDHENVPINSILYNTYKEQPRKYEHRIAMLLPYSTTEPTNYASILSYFSLFCYSVAGTADIMDFYIFHTGIISYDDTTGTSMSNQSDIRDGTTLRHCPPNVIFINLQDYYGLAQYLLRVVDVKYNDTTTTTGTKNPSATTPIMKYEELIDLVQSYIKMNPYGLVEFKPALGHIFQEYIVQPNYTHWGYTDFDILFGDISRWITYEELNDYDIVTYTFGDQQRLYVRGQFTIHKNIPSTINQLWRQCSYLSNLDQRFEAIIQHSQKYHVESAEGCYSDVLLNQTNISIKFAVKAWTDIYTDDTVYSHGIAISQSPISGRQVIYKLGKNNRNSTSSQSLYQLRSSWFETDDTVYSDRTIDIQRSVGERIRLDDPYDTTSKPCMYWALSKYQSKLCLKDGIVSSNDIVYFINGVLYKQQYENLPIQDGTIVTTPLFHFQEWKRTYRYEQLATIHSSSTAIQTYLLLPEGVIPMIASSSASSSKRKQEPLLSRYNFKKKDVLSPLGITDMKTWNVLGSNYDKNQLPLPSYCIRSRLDGSKRHSRCDTAISWHESERIKILSNAPGWKKNNINVNTDVTLVLTLQFLSSWNVDTNLEIVQSVIDNLKLNIHRWYGQPCVVVISIPYSFHKQATEYLQNQLNEETNPNLMFCWIAIIPHDQTQENDDNDEDTISRKALMNMAIDMVPTRWYISGIELERGLVLSMDTSYFAHRTALSFSTLRGNIFILPQFGDIGLSNDEMKGNEQDYSLTSSLNFTMEDVIRYKRYNAVKPLAKEIGMDCVDQGEKTNEFVSMIIEAWLADSLVEIGSVRSDIDFEEMNIRRIRSLDKIQQSIIEMAQSGKEEDYVKSALYTFNESPILLTDNLGPFDGIQTNEVVREIEAFGSIRCYNSVRLSQMILMHYTLNMLPGAFVFKNPNTRIIHEEVNKQPRKGCPAMCTNFLDDDEFVLSGIAWTEIKRSAKTAIVWAETTGVTSS
jgi:hypothetical protein